MSHEQARDLLQLAQDELQKCHDQLGEMQPVDLAAFDKHVRHFCEVVQNMPMEDAALYNNAMNALGDALDALQQALHARRDELKQRIEHLNTSQGAHAAYSAADKKRKES